MDTLEGLERVEKADPEAELARQETELPDEEAELAERENEVARLLARAHRVRESVAQALREEAGGNAAAAKALRELPPVPQLLDPTDQRRLRVARQAALAVRREAVIGRRNVIVVLEQGLHRANMRMQQGARVAQEARASREQTAQEQAAQARQRAAEERRKRPRIALSADVDLETDTNFYTGLTGDISTGGLFVFTLEDIAVGSHVDVHLALPGCRTLHLSCVARWVRTPDTPGTGTLPGVGLQFLDLTEADHAAITDFIGQREPLLYEA